MSSTPADAPNVNEFFRTYSLPACRERGRGKLPAPHQNEAIQKLNDWYRSSPSEPRGGVLVLPTGGGKTFTAIHFLCTSAISDGYKVLWLAHTHHLLEQALYGFEGLLGLISEPLQKLDMRVVSGTPGHSRAHSIKASDDVLIISLQTARNAVKEQLKQLVEFLDSTKGKLFVVFDEAHHSPAPSFRNLLLTLRARFPEMHLLGLTATPVYSVEDNRGWLLKLFPQGIVYQADPRRLMAAGVLAQPIPRDIQTSFEPSFNERDFQKWSGTYKDLPEEIITSLAKSQVRNDAIASHYWEHRDEYGKTIIFADRWFQCDYLREALRKRGVRADVVYSKVEADLDTAELRNRRKADENSKVLRQFKTDELDVLINVRMLTEGTDVPKLQTVFLTRQTTSDILLTQMIGRALRGPKFDGTAKAYIVSFIDNWKHAIPWAEFDQFIEGPASEVIVDYAKRPPLQLISIELVRRLARQMDSGIIMNPLPYRTYLPVGWYEVRFDATAQGSDDVESVRQLRMVFDAEKSGFETFICAACKMNLAAFQSEDLRFDDVREQLAELERVHFVGNDRAGGELVEDLFAVVRHIAQNEQTAPKYHPFEARELHDLDAIAQAHIAKDLGPRQANDSLRGEYARMDRIWRVIYPTYDLFKSHYDAAMNRLLGAIQHGVEPAQYRPVVFGTPEIHPDREPSEDLKEQVKRGDRFRCLCCGRERKQDLQVDHIFPDYHGGLSQIENLQTLCKYCNGIKGTNTINFRVKQTSLTSSPTSFPELELPSGDHAKEPVRWEFYLRHAFNLFFRCGAVESVEIGQRGPRFRNWEVRLFAGNKPGWLEPFLPALVERIRGARQDAGHQPVPDAIQVSDHSSAGGQSENSLNSNSSTTSDDATTSEPTSAKSEKDSPRPGDGHRLGGQTPMRSKGSKGLTVQERKSIFLALVSAQDVGGVTVLKSKKQIAAEFHITKEQLDLIEKEGVDKDWPPLDE